MSSNKPNILFIMTDQQHAGMMSCAGNPHLSTPAMDSLARGGIRFEKACCTNPVCAPSRVSMATGMMPCRLGADSNPSVTDAMEIPSEVVAGSMGNVMKRAGYRTFYGGKVHMCDLLHPENAGYDEFFSDDREALPAACSSFFSQKHAAPFFAVASFINPHDICFAHRAKNGINTRDVLPLYEQACSLPDDELPPLPDNYAISENEPPAVKASLDPEAITPAIVMRDEYNERDWRITRWIYNRLTEKVDRHVGEILAGLDAAGLAEDTLIIFASDHGNMDASHRLTSKFVFFEESVGVPLIMKYPAGFTGDRIDREHLVSTGLDILPTLYDYAEIDKPAHLLGSSLRSLAEGHGTSSFRDYVVSECEWFRMIRTDRFKYCSFTNENSLEWLGDLDEDPGEMRNLAHDIASRRVLEDHRERLADWSKRSNDTKISSFLRND